MKKKKLKGMTLVECITALAVLAVMTTAMATAAAGLSKNKVNANNVINKNSYQSQFADNKIKSGGADLKGCEEKTGYKITITKGSDTLATIDSSKYVAKTKTVDASGNEVYVSEDGRNYQYYDNFAIASYK